MDKWLLFLLINISNKQFKSFLNICKYCMLVFSLAHVLCSKDLAPRIWTFVSFDYHLSEHLKLYIFERKNWFPFLLASFASLLTHSLFVTLSRARKPIDCDLTLQNWDFKCQNLSHRLKVVCLISEFAEIKTETCDKEHQLIKSMCILVLFHLIAFWWNKINSKDLNKSN